MKIDFSDLLLWMFVAVSLLWGFGAKERFDCSVLKIDSACAEVDAEYKPKPPETPAIPTN